MANTITVELPDETLLRYQQGASAARKNLEAFIVDRLVEAVPPLAADLPSPVHEELSALEGLDDKALWRIARSRLRTSQQRLYDELLAKNSQGTITSEEAKLLHTLGDEARRLTLKKAHAYMLLKWRGYALPSPDVP